MNVSAAPSPNASEKPIVVKRITVEDGRLVCDVVVGDPGHRFTGERLGSLVRGAYPDIVKHACVNDETDRFAPIMDSTSLPHLLEHVVIDIQTHRCEMDAATFVGATEWTDESQGEARIQLSFINDFDALRAFKDALDFLNDAVLACVGAGTDKQAYQPHINERATDS